MAGLPNYSDNPTQAANYNGSGNESMEIALATKMQLVLDQPMSDVETGLCNRDFEGDFFKIGDTVKLIKPDASGLTIKFGAINTKDTTGGKPGYTNKDARLIPGNIAFEKTLLTIDKYVKYAFYISDLLEVEGKWNYESGNLDRVAQEIRKNHNLETVQMVVDAAANGDIETLSSSPTSPISVATGDDLYEKVIVPAFAKLYDNGAITADGQLTYGSNAEEGKSTFGKVYMPTAAYTELLISKYLQDRSTVAADEKVATGKVKTVMGLDVAIEPSLNPTATRHITIPSDSDPITDVVAIVFGTKNLITKAGKVLPPEKFRSHEFFADEYHGMEIYNKTIVEPKAGVCVFVKLGELQAQAQNQ